MDVLPLDAGVPAADERRAAATAVVDPHGAARFACAQLEAPRRALLRRSAGDVAAALAEHDRAHAAWLRLISDLGRAGCDRAREAALDLYAAHGRVAGRLERQPSSLLGPRTAFRADAVVVADLEDRTSRLVRTLADAAAGPAVEVSGDR